MRTFSVKILELLCQKGRVNVVFLKMCLQTCLILQSHLNFYYLPWVAVKIQR
jgi:hypothetical protein